MTRAPFLRASLVVLALLAACGDRSGVTSPFDGSASPAAPITPASLQMLECHVTVATGKVACADGLPRTGADLSIIVGGQNTYVALGSTTTGTGGDTLAVDVTVKNLIPQALGSADGTASDGTGVNVFFVVPPHPSAGSSGSVSVMNPSGTGVFNGSGQQYFNYAPATLGGDQILSQGETSGAVRWKFAFDPTVTNFDFNVYVSANVHYPLGYVDVTPSAATSLANGSTVASSAIVHNTVGDVMPEAVVWSTGSSSVATVDNAGLVTATGVGHTSIIASSGTRAAGSSPLYVCPNLAVGEAYSYNKYNTEAGSFCLAGGSSGAAEYTLLPINQSTSSVASLTVLGAGIQAVTGPPSPDRLAPAGVTLARLEDQNEVAIRDAFEARMRERDAATMPSLAQARADYARRVNAEAADPRTDPLIEGMRTYASSRPVRAPRSRTNTVHTPGGVSRVLTSGTPNVGDLMDLNTNSACSGSPSVRTGMVRSVSPHLIIVADTANPAGGFTTAQYDSIGLEFDSIAYGVDTAAFGAITDEDGNGHVVAFFTRAVNELSPPASSQVTLGFFASKDLFSNDPATGCTNSNMGEMFYMLVPDPTGAVNSNVRTVSSFRTGSFNSVGTMGHEFQHMINAFRRAYVTNASALEVGWLNEGLSHIAEELMFYRMSKGLAPKQNLPVSSLNTGANASARVAAFNAYANPNYGRFKSWLQRPDTTGPFKSNGANSLAVRGAIWSFLRYAADRSNIGDNTFFYGLVNNNFTGLANIRNAIGDDPQTWERDWAIAMYADDNAFSVASNYQTQSWNFRSVYGALGGFPLGTRALTNSTPLTLSYSTGGANIFARLAVPQGTTATMSILRAGGLLPDSTASISVVRTK